MVEFFFLINYSRRAGTGFCTEFNSVRLVTFSNPSGPSPSVVSAPLGKVPVRIIHWSSRPRSVSISPKNDFDAAEKFFFFQINWTHAPGTTMESWILAPRKVFLFFFLLINSRRPRASRKKFFLDEKVFLAIKIQNRPVPAGLGAVQKNFLLNPTVGYRM